MSQSILDPAAVELAQRRTPPLKHLVCPCQQPSPEGHAVCGALIHPARIPADSIPPMDLCVICGDFRTDRRPCPDCGRLVDGW